MKRVIIVDDQATNRRVMSMLISRVDAKADVHVFEDPIEALVYAHQYTPDLLITDFRMPFINGVELIRRFRDFPHCGDVPAVMVTAHQDTDARRLAFEAGTTDFLSLPFDHAKFCERSRALLALSDNGNNAQPISAANSEQALQTVLVPPAVVGQVEMFNRLLETVGSKLLQKTEELDRMCAEMESLIGLFDKPVVVVDQALEIRWYSKSISDVFCLDRTSIGAPITSAICKLNYHDLEYDILFAGHTCETVVRQVRGYGDGQLYQVKIIPNMHSAMVRGVTLVFEKTTSIDLDTGLHRTWH
jgi:CheY-like chemotaxis protein